MRRLIALCFVVLAGLPLLGTASPQLLAPPLVVVYAFALNGGSLEKDSGSKLAVIVANQMLSQGKMKVDVGPSGTERKDFLAVARAAGADYYVAGYITPLGDDVTVVEQVVSTNTGVVVFSNTAQLNTYADAAGQGELLHDAIIRHSERNLDAYITQPPPRVATPEPNPSQGAQANIGKLFGRKKQATRPAASPSPNASARPVATVATAPTATDAPNAATSTAAPTRAATAVPHGPARPRPTTVPGPTNPTAIAVLDVIGSAPADRRTETTQALAIDLDARKHKAKRVGNSTFRDAATTCSAAGNASAILSGSLAMRTKTAFGTVQTTATLELTAYTCAGKVAYRKTFERDAGGNPKLAIDRVAGAAIGAYLNPRRPRSRR